jgi:hypothetical protein
MYVRYKLDNGTNEGTVVVGGIEGEFTTEELGNMPADMQAFRKSGSDTDKALSISRDRVWL